MSYEQRDLAPVEAAERFLDRRKNRNTARTVRSYRTRLAEFVRWADENGIEVMRDLDGWWLDEYERHLEAGQNAPTTIKGKMVALDQLVQYCETIEVVEPDLSEKIELPRLSKDEETSDDMLESSDALGLVGFFRDSGRHRGTRLHVALELMFHVGGRVSCFRALDLQDWRSADRTLEFHHRPPTRLKDGTEHERHVLVSEEVADVVDLWIERERPEKRDKQGRKPLLTTHQGRASDATIQSWAYQATQPCWYLECPHNRRRPSCEYTQRNHASKCPSSRSPHAIRTGSITWQLNNGLSYVKVAKRVAASPETIRRYYDKPDHEDELERRRPETENLDLTRSRT